MAELIQSDDWPVLVEELARALTSVDELRTWLTKRLPPGVSQLGTGSLETELTNLLSWANATDGMKTLLQKLVDFPPGPRVQVVIHTLTHAQISARQLTARGLPVVSAEKSWFAADRPFVNRGPLRDHLRDLAGSEGAKTILVIDGGSRTGKSFAISLIEGFEQSQQSLPPIDIDEFAKAAVQVDARELCVNIVGDNNGCPDYDDTKEAEAVPKLELWLARRLRNQQRWIVIDHCDRKVLTPAARQVLKRFAQRLRDSHLRGIRLILVDFDLSELPPEWRKDVRHDQARLPDEGCVEQWCSLLAQAAKRKHDKDAPKLWAGKVFKDLDQRSKDDGSWHVEFEQRLQQAVEEIMACEEQP